MIRLELKQAYQDLKATHRYCHRSEPYKCTGKVLLDEIEILVGDMLKFHWLQWCSEEESGSYPEYWEREHWTDTDWRAEAEKELGS